MLSAGSEDWADCGTICFERRRVVIFKLCRCRKDRFRVVLIEVSRFRNEQIGVPRAPGAEQSSVFDAGTDACGALGTPGAAQSGVFDADADGGCVPNSV